MKDDKIIWFKDPSDFKGFDIRRNGARNHFDVFGLLRRWRGEVWVLCGSLTIEGYDSAVFQTFIGSIVFSILFSLPLVFNLLIWR